MKIRGILIAATAVALIGANASAETVGLGTTKGGLTAQVTATISKVVSTHSDGLQMRTQVMGGTQKYIPVVNAGELEFGVSNISNIMQYTQSPPRRERTGSCSGNCRLRQRLLHFLF